MSFRLFVNCLESRDNPSGPDLLDPTGVAVVETPEVTSSSTPSTTPNSSEGVTVPPLDLGTIAIEPIILW